MFIGMGPALAHDGPCVSTASLTFNDLDLEMWAQWDEAFADADDHGTSINEDCADVTMVGEWEDKGGHSTVNCAWWETKIGDETWRGERTENLSGQDGEVRNDHLMPVETTHGWDVRTTLYVKYDSIQGECVDEYSQQSDNGVVKIHIGDTN